MENPKFQIFKGQDNQYYFRLRARNGEVVCSGEGYISKQACIHGIEVIKQIAPTALIEELPSDS